MSATLRPQCPNCGGRMWLWVDCFRGKDQPHSEWHCLLCGAWWADRGIGTADFEAFCIRDVGGGA